MFQDGQKHLATSVLHWVQGGMRRTALHWACQHGDVKCVEALVAAGADTTVRSDSTRSSGCTATSAWYLEPSDIVEALYSVLGAQVQGKSWSQLVQGQRCGQLLQSNSPSEHSPSDLCSNSFVRCTGISANLARFHQP